MQRKFKKNCFFGIIFILFNIAEVKAEIPTTVTPNNFEVFSSILEKDYPNRKFPVYDYAPTLMKDGNVYRLWWLGRDNRENPTPQGDLVFYAESYNGITWSEPLVVVEPDHTEIGTDGYYLGNPSVIKINGIYHMYLSNGNGGITASGEIIPGNSIGYTSSIDGINWGTVKVVKAPFDDENLCCGTYGAGEPSVVFLDGFFYMAYIDSTGRASNPVNGSGIYLIRSPHADFSSDVEVLIQEKRFVPITADNETEYLWLDNTNGGEFAWSKQLNQFVYLRGGTSNLVLFDGNFTRTQDILFPASKNDWREENTFARTPEGHTVDEGIGTGIDMLVVGGYVTADVPKKISGLDIWWTDFQAVRFKLSDNSDTLVERPVVRLKHLSNGCPQDYQVVSTISNLKAEADGYFFSDQGQSWVLCALKMGTNEREAILIKHINNDCPAGYFRAAFLGNLFIEADNFQNDKARFWMLCSAQEQQQNAILMKADLQDCPVGYTEIAALNRVMAIADGFRLDPPRDWTLCSLVL